MIQGGDSDFAAPALLGADWPAFGWVEDVRPALEAAMAAKRDVALATLFQAEGSAPRGPGTQMLFDGEHTVGYFSGGCVEADVALHAADVIANGEPQILHYGVGSPWADIKLRCGGAIFIFVERVRGDSEAARLLLKRMHARQPALWISDGAEARIEDGVGAPLAAARANPLTIARRHDPRWRLIVSGWDPTALAIAKLGVDAQLQTYLVRPGGPETPPPVGGLAYLRTTPVEGLQEIGADEWTAFVGATHESELDIPACAAALRDGAGYVGLVGAATRVPERREAILRAGAPVASLSRLHAPAGLTNLGKAPWRIAVGIVGEILQTMNANGKTA